MKMLAQHKYKKDQKLKKQRLQVEKLAKEAIAEDEKRIYRQRKYEERPDYMSSVCNCLRMTKIIVSQPGPRYDRVIVYA